MLGDSRLMLILSSSILLAFLSSLIATTIGHLAIYIYQAKLRFSNALLSINNIDGGT